VGRKNYMAYDKLLKCDPDKLKSIRTIEVSEKFWLTTINWPYLNNEAEMYLLNSRNENVKQYLGQAYVDNLEEAKAKLLGERNACFFCIRNKINKKTVGYITLVPPYIGTTWSLGNWSINFWIGAFYQGQSIIKTVLPSLLSTLKECAIRELFAMIDKDNLKSIKIVEQLGFTRIEKKYQEHDLYSIKFT
jgi:RimJ/RimL family protein N-acetyltransferase